MYQSRHDGKDWEQINASRLEALKHQLEVYAKHNTSWSIWLWKGKYQIGCICRLANVLLILPDVGYQGMVYVSEETPYLKLLKPFLEKKKVGGSLVGSIY